MYLLQVRQVTCYAYFIIFKSYLCYIYFIFLSNILHAQDISYNCTNKYNIYENIMLTKVKVGVSAKSKVQFIDKVSSNCNLTP